MIGLVGKPGYRLFAPLVVHQKQNVFLASKNTVITLELMYLSSSFIQAGRPGPVNGFETSTSFCDEINSDPFCSTHIETQARPGPVPTLNVLENEVPILPTASVVPVICTNFWH